MSAFTMAGRGGNNNNNLNSTLTPSQSTPAPNNNNNAPMTAPYPRNDVGQAGVANRYPTGGNNYHLSPMTPQPQPQQGQLPPPPTGNAAQQPLGAFNFTPVPSQQLTQNSTPSVYQQQQQQPAQIQQQQQQGAAGANQNQNQPSADAMRDYVASLRAQVAGLKTEVEGNPAAVRRLSGSQPSAAAAQPSSYQNPYHHQQQQQLPPQAPANNNLTVNGTTATTTAQRPQSAGGIGASHQTPAAQQQRPLSASRTAPGGLASSTRNNNTAASSNLASSTIGSRSPASAGRTGTGRTGSTVRKGGKTTMAQKVMAMREDLKEKEENEQRLTAEVEELRSKYSSCSAELDSTRQMLFATDSNLQQLSERHANLEAEHRETTRQLNSSTTHGETLEAQVSVFRRAKELEHHEDRLFSYFLRHCLCSSCIPGAVENGEIPDVPADVPERIRGKESGLLASSDEAQHHCTENGSPIRLGENGDKLRVPHEIAQLVSKNYDELSNRADSQRSQIAQLNANLANRDEEIERLNQNCKTLQESLDSLRAQHRANENKLLLETSEKAAANVRCDDAIRMVHLLKASLRQALSENERISTELDKQLTRIQVIDANEAMHANRHDDANRTIEMRTSEIKQLRSVIATMQQNHNSLSNENAELRNAGQKLQEQIGLMRSRFDELSNDVSRRLQEQSNRVTQIEDHTMKLATTAVQAQMAEQEASKQAQRLIDEMRTESVETQKRTAAVVTDMHNLPSIMLPGHAQTIAPAFVQSTVDDEDDEGNNNNGENNNNNNTRARSPAGGNRSPTRNQQQEPKYGPNSPAGRLGTALAEAAAYGNASSSSSHNNSRPGSSMNNNNQQNNKDSSVFNDDSKLQELLSPLKTEQNNTANQQAEQQQVDRATSLAQQIRATLALDLDAKTQLDAAIEHANATIGSSS